MAVIDCNSEPRVTGMLDHLPVARETRSPRFTSRNRVRRLGAALAAVAAMSAVVSPSASAAETTVAIPQDVVIGVLNTVLAKMDVHLDAYGQRKPDGRYLSWLDERSYVRMGGAGTSPFKFGIGYVSRKTAPTRRLRAYVDDVNSTVIAAAMKGHNVRLHAVFESKGHEVKVKCLRYRVLRRDWRAECAIPSILVGKGINIDNGLATADLKPIAHKGSISFDAVATTFDASIHTQGLCGRLDGLCESISGYKAKLRAQVANRLMSVLDNPSVRTMIATSIRSALPASGIPPSWQITKVTVSNGKLIVTVKTP